MFPLSFFLFVFLSSLSSCFLVFLLSLLLSFLSLSLSFYHSLSLYFFFSVYFLVNFHHLFIYLSVRSISLPISLVSSFSLALSTYLSFLSAYLQFPLFLHLSQSIIHSIISTTFSRPRLPVHSPAIHRQYNTFHNNSFSRNKTLYQGHSGENTKAVTSRPDSC